MKLSHVEISNFRKLASAHIDFSDNTTLLVGPNNSGKTSAMLALRRFLVDGGSKIKTHDFTLSHWSSLNAIGLKWEKAKEEGTQVELKLDEWTAFLPALDIWLSVENGEFHHVSAVIPTLDWAGGLLGVRMRLEPKDLQALYKDFIVSVGDAAMMKKSIAEGEKKGTQKLTLWPSGMIDFLDRRLREHFVVRIYSLDPVEAKIPVNGEAFPQVLSPDAQPIEGNPLSNLIRVDEINAQRGFGHSTDDSSKSDGMPKVESRKLSDQLRVYYSKHLDPFQQPSTADLGALQAIEAAQDAFDERLKECFSEALLEVEGLGYPGVTDPRMKISTRLRAVDGLDHDAAVSYEIDVSGFGESVPVLRLPEDNNGLGYQNLISMVFRLMSFRDAWMRVGKAAKKGEDNAAIQPLHLVLIEEPEAHLHAQVQQVFIKKAYEVLRKRQELGENPRLHTQLVVSTHSNHVAHETPFASLRYFRRLPAGMGSSVPITRVVNLSSVFGPGTDTERFVTRYLRAQHADLFFADAVIMVEGPAERMLVPNFIRAQHEFLNQCYISILEIGGSHAHRLRPLIEHLGLLTLVVTDLDACRDPNNTAAQPVRGGNQRTNNATIKTWTPCIESVDELLDAADELKVIRQDQIAAVRVAYQTPTAVKLPKSAKPEEALSNTFEDALVFENIELFSKLEGAGLVRNFREAIAESKNSSTLGETMFQCLKGGKKAEFALEVIAAQAFESLKIPTYIAEGLTWLEEKLRKKQAEILISEESPEVGAAL